MTEMSKQHSHLIECDETGQELIIHRVHEDGRRVLYTRIPFSQIKAKGYASFVSDLGEAIALDSLVLRWLLTEEK